MGSMFWLSLHEIEEMLPKALKNIDRRNTTQEQASGLT
jgi:hypothetical protein